MDIPSFLIGKEAGGSGANLNDYFNTTYTYSAQQKPAYANMIKKLPPLTIVNGDATNLISDCSINQIVGAGVEELPIITNLNEITIFSNTFAGCKKITKVNFNYSTFSTLITNMAGMFRMCSAMTEIDMSTLGNITTDLNCASMFQRCTNLKKINLCNFNPTGNTDNIKNMFAYCTSLEELDVSSMDFSLFADISLFFGASATNNLPDNCLIYVKDQTQKTLVETAVPRLTNVRVKGA